MMRPAVRNLEAGVFGAAGMRESGTGVGIIRRRAHMGLGTPGGAPAGSVALRIAHLHAAPSQA